MEIEQLTQQINGLVDAGNSPKQVKQILMNLNPAPTGSQVEAAISNISNRDFAKKFFKMMNPNARERV